MTDRELICALSAAVGRALGAMRAEARAVEDRRAAGGPRTTGGWGLERAAALLEAELIPLGPALADMELTDEETGHE